jgi:hypothetical protein
MVFIIKVIEYLGYYSLSKIGVRYNYCIGVVLRLKIAGMLYYRC